MIARRYHYLAYLYYLGRIQHCRIRNPWVRLDRITLWLLKALNHHHLSLEPGLKYLSEVVAEAWSDSPVETLE
jgi:hypothetical protein